MHATTRTARAKTGKDGGGCAKRSLRSTDREKEKQVEGQEHDDSLAETTDQHGRGDHHQRPSSAAAFTLGTLELCCYLLLAVVVHCFSRAAVLELLDAGSHEQARAGRLRRRPLCAFACACSGDFQQRCRGQHKRLQQTARRRRSSSPPPHPYVRQADSATPSALFTAAASCSLLHLLPASGKPAGHGWRESTVVSKRRPNSGANSTGLNYASAAGCVHGSTARRGCHGAGVRELRRPRPHGGPGCLRPRV